MQVTYCSLTNDHWLRSWVWDHWSRPSGCRNPTWTANQLPLKDSKDRRLVSHFKPIFLPLSLYLPLFYLCAGSIQFSSSFSSKLMSPSLCSLIIPICLTFPDVSLFPHSYLFCSMFSRPLLPCSAPRKLQHEVFCTFPTKMSHHITEMHI